MQPAMRMSAGRYFVRAAMRASSFSCLALSSWLRAYALPCSAGSIGGLSAMSCIWSASWSRRFRSAAVGVPGSPRSMCSVWIRSQSASIWISTHFHRFASRSAVFFSSASASFTSRPRSSRYTASSSNWLNRSRCTRPPAFSYASSPTNVASPLLPITAPSVSWSRMCSGHAVPPPRAFAQTSSCALTVVGDGEGHQRLEVHLAVAEGRQQLRGHRPEPHHLRDLPLADAGPRRDLGRRHALGAQPRVRLVLVGRVHRGALLVLVERHLGGIGVAAQDAARRDAVGGDLAGLGELLQGGQPAAAGDHLEVVVAVGESPGGLSRTPSERMLACSSLSSSGSGAPPCARWRPTASAGRGGCSGS